MPPTPPLAGDKPQPYISLSTLGCRCSGDGGWCRRPAPEFIPDRSPGHAFLPMTRAGSGGIREKAAGTRQVGHPTPGWGQAPALHFSLDPGLSLFGRRWLASPAGAGHPGSESGTCFRANDAHETGPHRSEQLRSIRLFDRRWSRDYTQNSLTLPKFGYR